MVKVIKTIQNFGEAKNDRKYQWNGMQREKKFIGDLCKNGKKDAI